jgi:hypothetical protein
MGTAELAARRHGHGSVGWDHRLQAMAHPGTTVI